MATKKKIGALDKRGAKTRFFSAMTKEILDEINNLSSQGLTQFFIAAHYGMSLATWFEKIKIFPEISEAYWRGKSKGVQFATNSLKKLMEDGNERAIMFYLKNVAKFSEMDDLKEQDPKETKTISLSNVDPIEASKIYQSIMGES